MTEYHRRFHPGRGPIIPTVYMDIRSQIVVARTLTNTSSGPGTGMGTSL